MTTGTPFLIPLTVRVGPHTWRVDSGDEAGEVLREENRRGDSMNDLALIRLDSYRPHTLVAETLLHELLHALWAQTSLGDDETLDKCEERIVHALAPRLLALLMDNPGLVRFLTAQLPPGDLDG